MGNGHGKEGSIKKIVLRRNPKIHKRVGNINKKQNYEKRKSFRQ
jgi:hypothetical protein